MEKRKQQGERKETGRRQKGGYKRKEQMAISRLRTGYTRATHGPKMEGMDNPLCPFCNTDLSVDDILWDCKETEDQRTRMDMNKEQWINGKKGMEKMIDYTKEYRYKKKKKKKKTTKTKK
jgi:hypothetical protein